MQDAHETAARNAGEMSGLERAVRGEPMSRHTTARSGGPADWFIETTSASELRDMVLLARQQQMPYFVLGGGSNVLVSNKGVRGLVILNKARQINFQISDLKSQTGIEPLGGELASHPSRPAKASTPRVKAESGVILPTLARECIERGLAGLEWAIGVPGTVGGAVAGNAGAHGSDIAHNLVSATVLDADGCVREWSNQELQFGYRTSALKSKHRDPKSEIKNPVVLAAEFELEPGDHQALETRANEYVEKRKHSQPPGASLGSMFKNPPGDYAGRLIEAAGLKGARAGNAEISQVHANFFVNAGGASAQDVYSLICMARDKVKTQFGIELELEIELAGEW